MKNCRKQDLFGVRTMHKYFISTTKYSLKLRKTSRKFKEITKSIFKKTQDHFNFRCPLDGEIKVGRIGVIHTKARPHFDLDLKFGQGKKTNFKRYLITN